MYHRVPPAFATNDTDLALRAVLAGQVIGQFANFSAAAHIRAGRLVPLLLPHMSEHIGVHVYYGSHPVRPKRVRAFVELVIERLFDTSDIVLSGKELKAAHAAW